MLSRPVRDGRHPRSLAGPRKQAARGWHAFAAARPPKRAGPAGRESMAPTLPPVGSISHAGFNSPTRLRGVSGERVTG
jgi:hypothetical protein